MGLDRTIETVDGGRVEIKDINELTLPGYMTKNYWRVGPAVVILHPTYRGEDTGSHYIVGVKTYAGMEVPVKGWKNMLREWLIPEEVIAVLERRFAGSPEATL